MANAACRITLASLINGLSSIEKYCARAFYVNVLLGPEAKGYYPLKIE
jgi:hypothetical protein